MFFMLVGRLEMFPILLGAFSLIERVGHPIKRVRAASFRSGASFRSEG
jgi:hypothetical protein